MRPSGVQCFVLLAVLVVAAAQELDGGDELRPAETEAAQPNELLGEQAAPASDAQAEEENVPPVAQPADPCQSLKCTHGERCALNPTDQQPHCACVERCREETNSRHWVCTEKNETYNSECQFWRQRCLCQRQMAGCVDASVLDDSPDYYGPCQATKQCEQWELEAFPRRLREWLYKVMDELNEHKSLEATYVDLLQQAKKSHENNDPKAWRNSVIWKFCDLDISHDRAVDWKELFPLTAPFKLFEHCISPFLSMCDADHNGVIVLREWGHCLGLDDDEIEDFCGD